MSFKTDFNINALLISFPNQAIETKKSTDMQVLNEDAMSLIFSQLDLSSLVATTGVSKMWRHFTTRSSLLANAFYKEIPLGCDKWSQLPGVEIQKSSSETEYSDFLHHFPNIIDDYRKFKCAFPEKRVRDSLSLVRRLKIFNEENLLKLITSNKSIDISVEAIQELANEVIDKDDWVLVTCDTLPETLIVRSAGEDYAKKKEQEMIDNLKEKALVGYEAPEALNVVAMIFLTKCFNPNKKLFETDYTRCQKGLFVGNSGQLAAPEVTHCPDSDYAIIKIAAQKKFD